MTAPDKRKRWIAAALLVTTAALPVVAAQANGATTHRHVRHVRYVAPVVNAGYVSNRWIDWIHSDLPWYAFGSYFVPGLPWYAYHAPWYAYDTGFRCFVWTQNAYHYQCDPNALY